MTILKLKLSYEKKGKSLGEMKGGGLKIQILNVVIKWGMNS